MIRSLFLASVIICGVFSIYCPPGQYNFDDECYLFVTTKTTFAGAVKHCEDIGYSIVSICNAIVNNNLASTAAPALGITYGNYWIGYKRDGSIWDWAGVNCTTGYTNWDSGFPFSTHNCSSQQLPSGRWRSNDCNDTLPFLCQSPAGGPGTEAPTTTTTRQKVPDCKNYNSDTGFCYEAWTKSQGLDMRSAEEKLCVGVDGGHLSSLHSDEELKYILNTFGYPAASNVTSSELIWLGLNSTSDWSWIDGSPNDYEWGANQCEPCEDCCLAMSPANYKCPNGFPFYAGDLVMVDCSKLLTHASCKFEPNWI